MLAVVVAVAVLAATFALLYRRKRAYAHRFRHQQLPTRDRPPPSMWRSGTPRGRRTPAIKDAYRRDKVPDALDAIVVGSGVGGLATAAALARCGWRVLVVEQHDVAGGSTHTFEEHGVEFDTGTHYIGALRADERAYFDLLAPGVQFDRIDRADNAFTYDVVCVGDGAPVRLQSSVPPCSAVSVSFPTTTTTTTSDSDSCGGSGGGGGRVIAASLCERLLQGARDSTGVSTTTTTTTSGIVGGDDVGGGACALVAALCGRFPQCPRASIVRYVALVRRTARSPTLERFFRLKAVRPRWLGSALVRVYVRLVAADMASMLRPARDVLEDLFPVGEHAAYHTDLLNVLTGQWGDYGAVPTAAPFCMHAGVVNHYMDGAVFPRGGAARIAEALVRTIEQAGGRVLVKANVRRIVLDASGRARGVLVYGDAEPLHADVVVSGAGFEATRSMLPPAFVPGAWRARALVARRSPAMLYLFVALDGSPDELTLPAYNVWSWPWRRRETHADGMRRYFAAGAYGDRRPPTFIGFPCAKDTAWSARRARRDAKSNALVLTMAPHEWFVRWADDEHKQRGDAYEALKKHWQARLLDELLRHFPHLRDRVTACTVGTPLTFAHYIAAPGGQVYGMALDAWRFTPDAFDVLRPETEVPGLFLTGQDITTLGIASAFMSGVLTAHTVLGYGDVRNGTVGGDLLTDVLRNGHKTD